MNTISKIHSFWNEKARLFKTSQDASWSDILVKREITELAKYLRDGDSVLDVGCASGYSSLQLAQKKNIRLLGIDYVKEMIKNADKARSLLPKDVARRVQFREGNAMKLAVPKNAFDVVISTRCLCNLTSWKDQEKAVLEMWKALKPNGVLLLSEPTKEGLVELNKLGSALGLKPLTSPWHNLYLEEKKLLTLAPKYFSIKIDYFSSTYYLLSRIIYRWLKGDDPSKLRRDSFWNKLGVALPSIGNWGVQRLYIMQKAAGKP